MPVDVMVLKADADVASPRRLTAARACASDPETPRRALTELGWERAASPTDYLGRIATGAPAIRRSGTAASWQMAAPRVPLAGFDATAAIVAQLDLRTPVSGLFELSEDERLSGYDALSDAERGQWVAAFQALAAEWLDVTANAFADDSELPQTGEWREQVVQYLTVDGGRLLICVADDQEDYQGAAAWFESVLFVLGQVADAAGIREPTRFDVD